jgi:hypothetical protein
MIHGSRVMVIGYWLLFIGEKVFKRYHSGIFLITFVKIGYGSVKLSHIIEKSIASSTGNTKKVCIFTHET